MCGVCAMTAVRSARRVLGPDDRSARPMGAARLRIVRSGGESAICRVDRRAASVGMAPARTGLCAGSVVALARIGGDGHRCRARWGVRRVRLRTDGAFHRANRCALSASGRAGCRGEGRDVATPGTPQIVSRYDATVCCTAVSPAIRNRCADRPAYRACRRRSA
jgi:hypothetical protein